MDKSDPDPKLGPIQYAACAVNGWRYHIGLLVLLVILFITVFLTLNYIQQQIAPIKAQTQCLEIDRLFVGTTYQWNEETLVCEIVKTDDD